ncbi:hypothetical protein HYS50_03050 [Candidatus Woesearchaeota archaeon]|nr:hypothetical protein [Candidatus Woesearchaeota archaeon]
MYVVYRSGTFLKQLKKYPRELEPWLLAVEDQLAINPYVGDPLGTKWLREKKQGKFRVYYLIFEEWKAVHMAGISDKDTQQLVINTIHLLLDQYREELEALMRKK